MCLMCICCVHLCTSMCICVCPCRHMWKAAVDTGYLPFSILRQGLSWNLVLAVVFLIDWPASCQTYLSLGPHSLEHCL